MGHYLRLLLLLILGITSAALRWQRCWTPSLYSSLPLLLLPSPLPPLSSCHLSPLTISLHLTFILPVFEPLPDNIWRSSMKYAQASTHLVWIHYIVHVFRRWSMFLPWSVVWAKGQLRISTVHVVCKNPISRSETKYLHSANKWVKKNIYILYLEEKLFLPYLSFTSWNPTGSLYPLLTPPPFPSVSLNFSFRSLLSSLIFFLSCLASDSLSLLIHFRYLSCYFLLFDDLLTSSV